MPNHLEWQKKAACLGLPLEAYFESYETNVDVAKEVDKICNLCPVKSQCLNWAVENQATGVHGGVYLVIGKYSKNRNKHKTKKDAASLNNKVESIRKILKVAKDSKE